jgi:Integrase core domain
MPTTTPACESVISTIKNELIKRRSWTSRDQARLAVVSYIKTFYNPRRRHPALGYQSPIDYENMTQETPANAAAAQPQRVNGNGQPQPQSPPYSRPRKIGRSPEKQTRRLFYIAM